MKRHVFADERQWADTEPLRHVDALGGAELGLWCGTEDPFEPAARKLAGLAHPDVAAFAPGGHDADYWLRTTPEIITWLAARAN